MEEVIIALGSNLGDRQKHMSNAKAHLQSISRDKFMASALYETEPVGPAEYYFLNAVVRMNTDLPPQDLLKDLKAFEEIEGRTQDAPRWTARLLDLDIIAYGDVQKQSGRLKLPHPEYHQRLFVLEPLFEVYPDWIDPKLKIGIKAMLESAPKIEVFKTSIFW
ncbi:MAG: 2-amino-4-hydroxy-6-hydroxymethyldihydropteridine diphosphokinase [Balneolales bacterium]